MNTVNASTGFLPFTLKPSHSPPLIPPLIDTYATPESNEPTNRETRHMALPNSNETPPPMSDGEDATHTIMAQLANDILEARDSLTATKISQAHHTNKDHSLDPTFKVRECMMLATTHRQHDYMQKKNGCVAKFMPQFNGPFKVTKVYPDTSTYTLHLPDSSKLY